MKRIAIAIAALFLSLPLAAQSLEFDHWFRDTTMRLDYFHTGSTSDEIFALDEVVSDGPWAGSRTHLIDDLNLGEYLFQVFDLGTNRMIYSRGYSSIYGEWTTTAEAAKMHRTFSESLRFPWPKNPVRVTVLSRDADNVFEPVWSTTVDPNSRFVNPAPPAPRGKVWTILDNGDSHTKVDLLILGDGYTAAEMDKFHADAKRLVGVLFETEPYRSRKADFNVRAIDTPSAESGVSRPRAKQFRRTPIGTTYNIFDSERYALTLDNKSFRNIAAGAPYEYVEILLNEAQYGGGGIYNDMATASVGAGFANYLFIHEFGHHFADLADEYYTSDVSYQNGATWFPEPWQPNVTALHDPETLKWKSLVESSTPIPTPWKKEEFEAMEQKFQQERRQLRAKGVSEEVMDAYFNRVKAWSTPFLANQKDSGKVGAFEGANYQAKGMYRPEIDCIMFTRDDVGFCRVCSRAIERIIDFYSR